LFKPQNPRRSVLPIVGEAKISFHVHDGHKRLFAAVFRNQGNSRRFRVRWLPEIERFAIYINAAGILAIRAKNAPGELRSAGTN
jgi:hypothetical protein